MITLTTGQKTTVHLQALTEKGNVVSGWNAGLTWSYGGIYGSVFNLLIHTGQTSVDNSLNADIIPYTTGRAILAVSAYTPNPTGTVPIGLPSGFGTIAPHVLISGWLEINVTP